LRLWLLYDMFQCQNVRAKNFLNAHIRSVTFLCKHTDDTEPSAIHAVPGV
jgi:hypothetical protein